MTEGRLPPRDLLAALEARQELGSEYERAVVEGFVEQISREIDARVDARVDGLLPRSSPAPRKGGTTVAFWSMVFAIPLSAIAGSAAHLPGLEVAWGGIVMVNAASAWRSRPPALPRRGR